ncbi:MAG: RIP metalloprotease RseP [Acidobacteriota bacterium]
MRTIVESFLTFIFVLGILVFIHEFGHFIMARLFRIKVKVFSLGFGNRLVGYRSRKSGTDYRISLIPLGGYVKLAGENPDEHDRLDYNEFLSRPRYQRFLVIVMGALFNIVLSIVLATFIFMHGIQAPALPEGTPVVEVVKEGSPGEKAGIISGDRILEIDGKKLGSLEDFTRIIFLRPDTIARIMVERGGELMEKELSIIANPDSKYREGYTGLYFRIAYHVGEVIKGSPADKAGLKVGDRIVGINGELVDDSKELVSRFSQSAGIPLTLLIKRGNTNIEKVVTPRNEGGRGIIGVRFEMATKLIKKDFPGAVAESLRFAYSNMTLIFVTLKNLIRGGLSPRVFSGPIEIASLSRESYREGFIYFLYFIALVSLQLGIVNLFPIPVLDGGYILILITEAAIRKDFNARVKEIIMQLGLIFLIVLTGIIIYFDIIKSFFS